MGNLKDSYKAQILTVSEFDKWIVDFTPLDDRNSVVQSGFAAEPSIFQPTSEVKVHESVMSCFPS
jgi:hypothetical protein